MFISKHVLLLIVLSTPVFVFASSEVPTTKNTPDKQQHKKTSLTVEELRKLQGKLQDHPFLSVDFEQKIYKKLRNKTLSNKGQVYFKKPSSFRWIFSHSESEEWVYNGNDLLHYFPTKNYAHRYKPYAAKGKNLREIVNMVLDFDSLLKRYTVVSAFQDAKLVTLNLAPKERGEITEVVLGLDLEKNLISEVTLNLEGGNQSSFRFTNPRYNQGALSFELPSKVKITDAI